uniref:PKD-like family lipoprotein n=1 Tax=Pedobacter sp. TaxID=1411316 RepID=UPI003D7FBF5D
MNISYRRYKGVLLLAVLFLASCYKDESTEGINPINEVLITDTKTEAVITVFQGDTLKLKPNLTQSQQSNLDQLEFKWLVYNNNGAVSLAAPRVEISKDAELNYIVKGEPFILGENYIVRLEVKDKNSQVSTYLNYKVLVGNGYGVGWLVLEDKAGKGDLSFVFPNFSVEHGMYNDRNTSPIIGPKKLEITPFVVSDDISAAGNRLYILADQGSQEYNYLTMVKKFNYAFEFFSAPAVEKPQYMNWTSQSSYNGLRSPSLGVVINDGKLHSNLVGGFPGVKKWGDIALNPQGNRNYNLAPFAVGGPSFAAIVYDNLDKRFYQVRAYNPSPVAGTLEGFPSGGTTGVSTVFEMNNVGMTMLFQDSADVANEYNAVMKDNSNQLYLLRYKTVNTTAAPNITLGKTQMNAPGMLSFSAAAGSTTTPHLYYGNANILSRYETSSNNVVENFVFAATERITAIKYAKYTPDDKEAVKKARLAVATWDGTEGRLYFFSIPNLGTIGQPTHTLRGFSQIVDLV